MIFWSNIGVNIHTNDQPVEYTDNITYIYLLHEKWYMSECGYRRRTMKVHKFDRSHSLPMLLRICLYCRQQVLQRELEVQPLHSSL